MNSLKPCPFCGGKAMLFKHGPTALACCASDNCPGWSIVRCTPDAWNTRAPDQAEALRQEADVIRHIRNWIRDDCTLAVKMTLLPSHVDALAKRIMEARDD